MKLSQTTILLCTAQLVAARAVLQTRSSWCQAVGQTEIMTGGGYPDQPPFTNTDSRLSITNEGNLVYENTDNLFLDSYSVTIQPSQWGGADPIEFQSTWDIDGYTFTSCSLTDTNSGQYYSGQANSSFQETTVTFYESYCTINFLC